MEIIKKQSLQSSTIQIIGAFIGAVSTILIYPLDLKLYGIYGFLTNTASLMVPFITLGFGNVLLRYFPYFNDSEKKNARFFGFIFSGYALGILLFSLLFLCFYNEIIGFFYKKDPLVREFIIFLLPLGILYVLFDLFTTISINFQKITIPALTVFILKILLPIVFLSSFYKYITRFQFAIFLCLYYAGITLWLLLYLIKLGKLKISFSSAIYKSPNVKFMMQFAVYSILGGASAIIALRIDSILITSFLGSEANGLFTLGLFLCNVSYIPSIALTDSLNAAVSALSKNNNTGQLQTIYTKSSKNMLLSTMWISICIYVSFLSLSQIMPNSDKVAFIHPAIGWLLLARISDAATGINHHILSYSKYYKIELYLLLLMAFLNISLIYFLLPIYGINGTAFATFASVFFYNLLKTFLVYQKLRIQPFSKESGMILILGLASCLLLSLINLPFISILNILAYSILTSVLFLGSVYYLKLSPEFNHLLRSLLTKILPFFNKQ